METAACYPGTFDPVTFGHLDVIRRASRLFERLVVAVGKNVGKAPCFTPDERVEMLREALEEAGLEHVLVHPFDTLVVEFCRSHRLQVIVRGVRSVSDFESEMQMGFTNRGFAPEIETLFLMPGETYAHVSSRLIKEVALVGGPVDAFVPPKIARLLASRLKGLS